MLTQKEESCTLCSIPFPLKVLKFRNILKLQKRTEDNILDTQLLLLSHLSHVRLCNPLEGSLPGSPVPGILQARTLEWVAISFSNARK